MVSACCCDKSEAWRGFISAQVEKCTGDVFDNLVKLRFVVEVFNKENVYHARHLTEVLFSRRSDCWCLWHLSDRPQE